MTLPRTTGFGYLSENGHNSASLCTLGMHIYVPEQESLNSLKFIKFLEKHHGVQKNYSRFSSNYVIFFLTLNSS